MTNRTDLRKGFTLIEMLIVVAIIGILASLVLVGLGPVQRQGRDARRISDLRQVQTGLELYFIKEGHYPSPAPSDWAGLVELLKGDGIGVSNVPQDPSASSAGSAGGRTYRYGSDDGTSYVLAATLEDTSSARLNDDVDGTIANIDCSDPVYCIQL
jgi:prepilin-type N-terminal cleavage/methylation domain-containing protein